MGGCGSGSYYRWDKGITREEVKRIDIRQLKKTDSLVSSGYAYCSLFWNRGGEPSGDIRYTMYSDQMILNYRFRRNGEDWEPVEQTIRLDQTPCNYGGTRKWFLCTHCGKRVGVLYGLDKYFLCRHCTRIPYGSQQEGYLDRLCRKAKKIRKRLYGDNDEYGFFALSEPLFLRPKGLHRRTFERLKRIENRAQEEIERVMVFRWGHGWY